MVDACHGCFLGRLRHERGLRRLACHGQQVGFGQRRFVGLAIDIEKKDGSRNLLVPNIKKANELNFKQFFAAYNEQIAKARDGKLEIADFQGTTISLTNPGTIGTVASNPRLMSGQSAIIATGAIEFPAEYQAMTSAALKVLMEAGSNA